MVIEEAREAARGYMRDCFASTEASCDQFLRRTEVYDPEAVKILDDIEAFISKMTLPKGRKGVTRALGWQKMLICCVFGRMAGLPMADQTMVCIPRKQGKTSFAAALGLAALAFAPDVSANIHSVATKKEQAQLVWNDAITILRRAKSLDKRNAYELANHQFRILRDKIELLRNPDAFWNVLAHDSKTLDGLYPTLTIIDEAALVEDNVYNVICSAKSDTLDWDHVLAISTANYETDLWFGHYCRDGMHALLRGEDAVHNLLLWMPPENPATGDCLLSVDPAPDIPQIETTLLPAAVERATYYPDDWIGWIGDPEIWKRINPSWGVTIKEPTMRGFWDAAQTRSAAMREFRVKRINEWAVPEHEMLCTPSEAKATCNPEWDSYVDHILTTQRCVMGVDLAIKHDLTVLAAVAWTPESGGMLVARLWHFLCKDSYNKRIKEDRQVLFERWERDGYVAITGTDRIDFAPINAKIKEVRDRYDARVLWHDRMTRGLGLLDNIKGNVPVAVKDYPPKGESPMVARRSACNFFVDHLTEGKIRVAHNPCFAWELCNGAIGYFRDGGMEVVRYNEGGGGIDGIYAVIHASQAFRKMAGKKQTAPVIGTVAQAELPMEVAS